MLTKTADGSDPLDLLDGVLPVYARVLRELAEADAAWVQMDEPVLALDLPEKAKPRSAGLRRAAARPTPRHPAGQLFRPARRQPSHRRGAAGGRTASRPGARRRRSWMPCWIVSPERWLSLGLVDGRNVWRTDLRAALGTLQRVAAARGERRLMVAPSCSLLHVPVDVRQETKLDPAVKTWLAFAEQKLDEVATLARGLDEGEQ